MHSHQRFCSLKLMLIWWRSDIVEVSTSLSDVERPDYSSASFDYFAPIGI